MIALDSSVWIEMWLDDGCRDTIRAQIAERGGDPGRIVVPATVVHETYRWLLRNIPDERIVFETANGLAQHDQVAIDLTVARRAAFTSIATGLAAADATILAAARSRHAHLLTFDSDFEGIPDVTVLSRRTAR